MGGQRPRHKRPAQRRRGSRDKAETDGVRGRAQTDASVSSTSSVLGQLGLLCDPPSGGNKGPVVQANCPSWMGNGDNQHEGLIASGVLRGRRPSSVSITTGSTVDVPRSDERSSCSLLCSSRKSSKQLSSRPRTLSADRRFFSRTPSPVPRKNSKQTWMNATSFHNAVVGALEPSTSSSGTPSNRLSMLPSSPSHGWPEDDENVGPTVFLWQDARAPKQDALQQPLVIMHNISLAGSSLCTDVKPRTMACKCRVCAPRAVPGAPNCPGQQAQLAVSGFGTNVQLGRVRQAASTGFVTLGR
eukprot:TRINITY_DN42400_c0_g1_i1.p1 TRINITY_DN42400_c0_g1~~TRINITY_DN42400_c0_g1_i1.p1  ORF type:complete len:300 (+),score=40.44 TRINITY_DN42400_c0_g1_i1:32-931(+)